MKNLAQYMQEEQTKLFKRLDVFFAFSGHQFAKATDTMLSDEQQTFLDGYIHSQGFGDYEKKAGKIEFYDGAGNFLKSYSLKEMISFGMPTLKITSLGAGMHCPAANVEEVKKGLDEIYKNGIKQDLAENQIDDIIKRELCNYECYYTGDPEDAIEALEDYENITPEMIIKILNNGPDFKL